jgi:glycine dehydrogenase subunit 2
MSVLPAPGGRASSAPLVGRDAEPTIFELSVPGRRADAPRTTGIPEASLEEIRPWLRREPAELPEVSERDLVAHYTRLAARTYSVDLGAYPLGSCTMKYNPKFADDVSQLVGLANVHPQTPVSAVQGWLELLWELEGMICEITGMRAATLQPPAGAAGELTGLLIMGAYHRSQGRNPRKVIIPDSAHGTNPASVTLAGYEAVTVRSDGRGLVSLEDLERVLDENVAGIMLTNPNTLGLFERDVARILELVHAIGALAYYDGANLNAIVGVARPGDMGFDIVHANLHKTFATPHGGGGPGAGPVAVTAELEQFLPGPLPRPEADGSFGWWWPEASIGNVHAFHGNALVLARAWAFMRYHGAHGLRHMSQVAVLNARWLQHRMRDALPSAFDEPCMHEFVASAKQLRQQAGVRASDLAKALLEEGFHAPTVYFPLIVDEALMIEPTETESPQTLEALAVALEELVRRAGTEPERLTEAPRTTPVRRLDEVLAARHPVLVEPVASGEDGAG